MNSNPQDRPASPNDEDHVLGLPWEIWHAIDRATVDAANFREEHQEMARLALEKRRPDGSMESVYEHLIDYLEERATRKKALNRRPKRLLIAGVKNTTMTYRPKSWLKFRLTHWQIGPVSVR